MSEQKQPLANYRRVMASLLTMTIALGPTVAPAFASSAKPLATHAASAATATPIQYLVVIFNENVSFDHYFGTYPNAANLAFENKFIAKATTPNVNGLTPGLLTNNPNLNPANGAGASNPFRLDVTQAATADQDHAYTPEQQAFDSGLMDLFPLYTGAAGPPPAGLNTKLVMGYYDGNTVTAMWNYAQNFAMSDNSYGTTFGPSTPGLINLVSGQTNGVVAGLNPSTLAPTPGYYVSDGNGGFTVIGDADPLNDVCSNPTRTQVQLGGQTIGDLLTAAGVTWGGFMGGFNLSVVNPNGTTGCARSTKSNITGVTEIDYYVHHSLFGYWASTANPNHTRPASIAEIGNAGPANHQYDIEDFFAAVSAGNQPAVSFLKAPSYQDGHPGYSDPTDEQTFVVNTINFLQNPANNPNWNSTAVVIMYDDSDGWYDHVMPPVFNNSNVASVDELTGSGLCGAAAPAMAGIAAPAAQGRCGYGPRLPMLVISPWAKDNFVDHTVTDQTSVIHFIEDNWLGGTRIGNGSFDAVANSIVQDFNFSKIRTNGTLCLNPVTGERQNALLCGL
ncbi:MAG TPA: alkaline phosphatase family protein [Terriglobales bacterium]|jgi:phospholipase C|nr:alkaline phosphatase family protein [Terriglobales bacterium]